MTWQNRTRENNESVRAERGADVHFIYILMSIRMHLPSNYSLQKIYIYCKSPLHFISNFQTTGKMIFKSFIVAFV